MIGEKQNRGGVAASTPLHWAAADGDIQSLKGLLNVGAQIDAIDAALQTPLHRAAIEGQHDAAKILLLNGACPNPRDRDGMTPEALAFKNQHYLLAELIREWSGRRIQER